MLTMTPADVTAVILTKNEEKNLPACLAALPDWMPKVVVDSGSTDKTVALAKSAGAKIFERPWTGFADQRNFALRECEIATSWVLFVDADEIYSERFFSWLLKTISEDPAVDVFDVPSWMVLDGTKLNHAPGYPILHPRLVRTTTKFEVNHQGHGEKVVDCRIAQAPLGYDHYFQSGSLIPWIQKHVRLAEYEVSTPSKKASTLRARLSALAPKGPLRPLIRFFYHYVLRLGFLDGRAGFRYATMYAWYELTIWLMRSSR